jgi:hypothetical protein
MGTLVETEERLANSWSVLQGQWQSTRDVWLDAVRDEFERMYWEDIEATIRVAATEFRRLVQTIESVRKQLE